LLTDRQTDRQTNNDENITSLMGVIRKMETKNKYRYSPEETVHVIECEALLLEYC